MTANLLRLRSCAAIAIAACLGIAACRPCLAADEAQLPPPGRLPEAAGAAAAGVPRALLVVGVPGDEEHDAIFQSILQNWQTWLTQCLQFKKEHVTVLLGRDEAAGGHAPSTKDSVRQLVERLRGEIGPRDPLWVFYLGHASYDGRRAWLHLPGPDMNDMEWAELFAGIRSRQQVFWLTSACSGWFLKPLSREGRVVIAATEADREFNETEFPAALATVAQQAAAEIDTSGDSRVSLAELFAAVSREVEARFAADQRAPTEHAQLDDDGDGRGTEAGELFAAETPPAAEGAPVALRRDGAIAAGIFLPWAENGS
jgi:hypothetical protein